MAVTLDWFIHHSQLNNIRLVVGNLQSSGEITSVNILDNPDVLKWFKKNELILTTGYIFKDDPELQRTIIREMKEIGCAGLAVKIKRFFKTIPEPLLDEARKLDFPVIELPFFYGFSEIIHTVYNKLYLQQHQQALQDQQLITELSDAFFQHKDLTCLVKIMADFFGSPVLVTDLSYACLALAAPAAFDSGQLAEAAAVMADRLTEQTMPLTDFSLTLNDRQYLLLASLLPNHLGYLCLLTQSQPAASQAMAVLHKAAQIMALACEQQQVSRPGPANRAHFFLNFLMHHTQATPEETQQICSFYGFNYHKAWVCASFSLQAYSDLQKKKLLTLLQNYCSQTRTDETALFTCANDSLFCAFFLFSVDSNPVYAINEVRHTARRLCQQAQQLSQLPLPTGISGFHHTLQALHTSFEESLQALALQQRLKQTAPASYFHQIAYHLLLHYYKKDSSQVIESTLQPLLDFDTQNNTDLTATLKVYFQSKFNSSVAAKQLYLHRNTMLHRIEKIKELLHTDLSDMDENFLLYLGLCSWDLRKQK